MMNLITAWHMGALARLSNHLADVEEDIAELKLFEKNLAT